MHGYQKDIENPWTNTKNCPVEKYAESLCFCSSSYPEIHLWFVVPTRRDRSGDVSRKSVILWGRGLDGAPGSDKRD